MKIGYFCNATNWNNKPYNQVLEEVREIAIYCDQNEWNSIWFTEHHFSHEGMEMCPNPLMMSADIAARTKNIRIGQAANIITFWNPIRVAEDIALLDNLSNGRVEAGIGRGIYGREALNMNADADLKDQAKNFRLFEETLTILKKAWTEKFFSHMGEFYTFPSPNFIWQHDMSPPSEEFMNLKDNTMKKISVIPKPYQVPHPPIHQVVDGIRSIEWAAKNGINIIMWIPTVKALKIKFTLTVTYSKDFGKIEFEGSIMTLPDEGEFKSIMDSWKDKKIPENMRLGIFNFIMVKCNVKALYLEDEMGMPLHVPMPRLTKEVQKKE